ncbi:MAG: XRE family transcriptional regulator [Bacteroidetes bacterium]|nr:XRE family transcriptional regulator [Bacteroidota bacterium]MBU1720589.1 XRE family transcriptional regulator [Bacteroidota bacterium]
MKLSENTNHFAENIKILRKRKGRTQDDVAVSLNMKRSTLSGYENRVAEPGLEAMIAFSDYYGIAIDTLCRIDLATLSESQFGQLESGYDVFIKGSNLRILACSVSPENEENIELVNEKASAGYRAGYADPEFIKILPAFHLPFLSKSRKYRAFQIQGDSMLPIPDGSWVVGEFVQNWTHVRDRHPYIFLTRNDGIVFKIAENRIQKEKCLVLHSSNPMYDPYSVAVSELCEVWKFVQFMSDKMPENQPSDTELLGEIRQLRREVKGIQAKLDLFGEAAS